MVIFFACSRTKTLPLIILVKIFWKHINTKTLFETNGIRLICRQVISTVMFKLIYKPPSSQNLQLATRIMTKINILHSINVSFLSSSIVYFFSLLLFVPLAPRMFRAPRSGQKQDKTPPQIIFNSLISSIKPENTPDPKGFKDSGQFQNICENKQKETVI